MSLHCVISWDQESSPEDVETIGELDSRLTELRPALQDQEQPSEQEEERPNHAESFCTLLFKAFLTVFRIRIHRIHMFLGLPDPSIIKQK